MALTFEQWLKKSGLQDIYRSTGNYGMYGIQYGGESSEQKALRARYQTEQTDISKAAQTGQTAYQQSIRGLSEPIQRYYANQFGDLRSEWETLGSNKTWEKWLKGQNLKERYYKLSPYERGERQPYYSPRLRRISY